MTFYMRRNQNYGIDLQVLMRDEASVKYKSG